MRSPTRRRYIAKKLGTQLNQLLKILETQRVVSDSPGVVLGRHCVVGCLEAILQIRGGIFDSFHDEDLMMMQMRDELWLAAR
jgi:hypothetical protein